ncbi:MAG: GGDEF domain-containing protein, partial [Acidimicrobiales bacterium]
MNPGARRRPPPGPGAALVVAPGGGRGEQAALADRLGLLLVVRCGIVAFVVVGAVAAPRQLGLTVGQAGPISAAYLVLGGAVEWFRRNGGRGRLHVFRAMLPLDSLYLVLVTAPTGGPRSELEFLFFVQLVATTLLASPRTGLRIALWDSFLFVLVGALSLGPEIARLLGAGAVDATDPTALAVAIMAFWAVAVCTAVSSSVSERELRRSKAELGVMAALAVELEAATTADEILPILLRRSVEVFGAGRGAVLWGNERQLQAWRAGVADRFVAGPGVVGPGVVGPGVAGPGVVGPGVAGPGVVDHVRIDEVGGGDLIVRQAGAGRAPVLARRLDPSADPVLSGLLPGARNVVVVPLPEEGDQSGALALERGGTWHQRVPRRTLAVLEQLCSHATLALRSARLFAEVGRMATMDGLTGLANRREFDRSLEREVLRVQRSGEPLSLVLIDVDHFKAVNDSLGHLAGDEVLRAVATVLA